MTIQDSQYVGTDEAIKTRATGIGLRWWIIGLIFVITCVNYIDRSSIGLLYTQFGAEIHVPVEQYGWVGAILLLAYSVSQMVSGRMYDRYGARVGFTVSVVVWCIAAMAHAAMVGFASFAACSFFLGLGEAGNWPGAAKVVAEWFPQQERALAMAIFNGGASMGGVVGPLLVAGFLAPLLGWRWTFVVIGSLGFVWLAAWLAVYQPLATSTKVTAEERAYIRAGQAVVRSEPGASIAQLLKLRQTWGILLARFFVDPIWWLYMLWLPTYLKDVHHFSLKSIGVFQWFPFLCAAVGSLFGGWLSGKLIARGRSVNAARKIAMGIATCMMPFGILAARAESPYVALGLIAVVLFGFQMWISNVQTLPSDFFASKSVGTVAGMGGTAAGVSSLFFNLCTGWLVLHFGYVLVLTIAGVLAPLGAIALFVVAGNVHKLEGV
jgi:ACS family hexuronate transporter-like MFS transporter